MIKKAVPMLCIIVGLAILLYPTLNDRYESYRQQRIMQEWTDNLRQIDTAPAPPEAERPVVQVSPVVQIDEGTAEAGSSLQSDAPQAEPAPDPMQQENVEGVLVIDKIQLKLPILTEATVEHLKLSVASIAHTGKAGAVGNYAIAGHRNLAYGKNFNRLDELGKGDMIEVDTGKQQYWYQVQEKLYVLPEDVWVLKGNGSDREITLITCHPMKNPTHRLVVKGKLVEQS